MPNLRSPFSVDTQPALQNTRQDSASPVKKLLCIAVMQTDSTPPSSSNDVQPSCTKVAWRLKYNRPEPSPRSVSLHGFASTIRLTATQVSSSVAPVNDDDWTIRLLDAAEHRGRC